MENDYKIICDAPAKISYRKKNNALGQLISDKMLEKVECGKAYYPDTLCECSPRMFSKCNYYLGKRGLD